MKKIFAVLLCAGLLTSSYATVSRVIAMGRHDNFFMDEVSVFRNPANINIYPNMLMGSYGVYDIIPEDEQGTYPALERRNRDPRDPFFGAILTYSLQQAAEETSQYPMISLGAVLNRKDPLLGYINRDSTSFLDPKGKIDLMFGYALPNGGMIGIGGYMAFNEKKGNPFTPIEGIDTSFVAENNYETKLFKGTVGMNWPVARSMDLEGSIYAGIINAVGQDTSGDTISRVTYAKNDISFGADIRLFSALSVLNGDFVPHASIDVTQINKSAIAFIDVKGGLGLNINIDKGFFWAGVEGLYEHTRNDDASDYDAVGVRMSWGIERNIIWDWFVLRPGGTKTIKHVSQGNMETWVENPEHDSDDDFIGLGIGINIENRLKIDFLVAEDVPYTFTNLFSGPQHHLFTRFDATFSF